MTTPPSTPEPSASSASSPESESSPGRRTTLRLAAIPAEQAPPVERGVRAIAIVAVLILLVVIAYVVLRPQTVRVEPLVWSSIAPPQTTTMHPWRYIVIHHSASRRGNAQAIDSEHLNQRGWDGIGYHFVIGNGVDMPLGRIEATFRWRLQKHGAHAGSQPEQQIYNQDGIGICIIGNYDQERIDPFVEQRLVSLCAQLIDRVPTLSVSSIIGHRNVPGKITRCPGSAIDLQRLHFLVRKELQTHGMTVR